jgi:hypothetical protein
MEKKDFTYNYNSNGYMIYYKGKSIGGAGTHNSNPKYPW